MHNALVHANASAYLYWQMSDMNDQETEHILLGKGHLEHPTQSKKYSAFKHFSRYIRPGAVRVGATFRNRESSVGGKSKYDTQHALNVSAYVHEQDKTVTIVLINMRARDEAVDLRLKRVLVERLKMYLTSSNDSFASREDLVLSDGRASFTAPGYSVLTLHGNVK